MSEHKDKKARTDKQYPVLSVSLYLICHIHVAYELLLAQEKLEKLVFALTLKQNSFQHFFHLLPIATVPRAMTSSFASVVVPRLFRKVRK